MVAILPIGEVVVGQVRARHDDLVIDGIQLHMVQAPSFVDSLRQDRFLDTGQVRGVEYA